MEGTVYMILAPSDANVADVSRMAVEIYLNEDHPPGNIKAEAVGIAPDGQAVWAVMVPDGPRTPQEAGTGPPTDDSGDESTFDKGSP